MHVRSGAFISLFSDRSTPEVLVAVTLAQCALFAVLATTLGVRFSPKSTGVFA